MIAASLCLLSGILLLSVVRKHSQLRAACGEQVRIKSGRFSEEQIIGILKRQEAGQKVADLAGENGVSEAKIYAWKSKYGGLEVSEARLRQLEEENRRLKSLVANLSLDREVSKAVISKTAGARSSAARFRFCREYVRHQ